MEMLDEVSADMRLEYPKSRLTFDPETELMPRSATVMSEQAKTSSHPRREDRISDPRFRGSRETHRIRARHGDRSLPAFVRPLGRWGCCRSLSGARSRRGGLSQTGSAPDGIVAVGDAPTRIAALTAAQLGLRFHSHEAVVRCRDKFIAHERFREAGLPCPDISGFRVHVDLAEAVRSARFPCVLKPLGLSGSRGVIRANDESEFADAFERICAILNQPEVRRVRETEQEFIQIETYIPGAEFALEGLVIDGRLKTLALFDKPDPLEGPFFEETIY